MKHHRAITRPVALAQSTIETKIDFVVNLVDQAITWIFQKSLEF